MRLLKYLARAARTRWEPNSREMLASCGEMEGLITSSLGIPWVQALAEKFRLPWAIVQLSFPTTPTREFPFAGLRFLNFPVYNVFTYRLIHGLFWRESKKGVNEFRRSLGLPLLKVPPAEIADKAGILNLYAVSPSLVERPADWGRHTDITGFLTLRREGGDEVGGHEGDVRGDVGQFRGHGVRGWSFPVGLEEWLGSGEPPVYIGFGSMPVPDPELFRSVLEGLLAGTGDRFLFCEGWSAMGTLPDNPRLYRIAYADHSLLFPLCKAAVIHGGIGTIGAALRARVPLVVVSVFADQPWWGGLLQEKELAVHLPFKKLTTERLQNALELTRSPGRMEKLRVIGERVDKEAGVDVAVTMLSNTLFSGRSAGS